ncbi:MAG TPA: DUF342 domain-containing protein [Thermoanaerobacterales bacterium]|nr:DUF342 domain-containing protein [Thermoanaerobacterales bacterium]
MEYNNEKKVERMVEWVIEKASYNMSCNDSKKDRNDSRDSKENGIEDARMEVEVSKDEMYATIYIVPPKGGKMVSFDGIINELGKRGITEGIDYEKINEILEKGIFFTKVKIAGGKAPIDGQNAQIRYYFDTNKELKPTITDDGRVDYYNLNLVTNVKAGELLAEIIPPAKGIPGKTITGKTIPAKDGKEIRFRTGKNVAVSEDGYKLFSNIDGQPVLLDGKISVLQVLEIGGDVGPATGNINFLGSIIVRGSVKSGFKIKVEGDAEIEGTVEAAEIDAGGNIIIKRGIQGGGRGYLRAGGDITARYIENSNVEAGRNIVVYEAVMHSNLSAGKKIKIDGKKGLLVGGTSRAGDELVAKTIGSPMATYTEIEVGINPGEKKRLLEINQKLQTIKNDLEKTRQAIELLEKMKDRNTLAPDKMVLLEKLKQTYDILNEQKLALSDEKEELEMMITSQVRAKVSASNAAMPGVNIVIGNASLKLRDKIDHVTFYNHEGQIKFGTFEG